MTEHHFALWRICNGQQELTKDGVTVAKVLHHRKGWYAQKTEVTDEYEGRKILRRIGPKIFIDNHDDAAGIAHALGLNGDDHAD